MISHKILAIQKDDILLDCINVLANKTFRIEEIPKDEMDVAKDELLIPCAHFQKVRAHAQTPLCFRQSVGAIPQP